ncbi:hypothetical protein F5B20DRAFT_86486 [Whalleya microplaca]|nr:hypothetical protein F5B20DRAFT_86486 [Whalleya microplaca]
MATATRSAVTLLQRSSTETLQLRCHVRPGASKVREGVTGITDEVIQLCVAAQPQDGKSNKAVIEVLSETLGVPKSDLQITHGLKNRDKTISVAGAGLRRRRDRREDEEDLVAVVREKLLGSSSEA